MVGGVWHRPKSKINLFTISVPQLYKLIVSFKYLWYLWFFNHTRGTLFEMTSICSRVKPPTSKLFFFYVRQLPSFFQKLWLRTPFDTSEGLLTRWIGDRSAVPGRPFKTARHSELHRNGSCFGPKFQLFFTWCALEDWSVFFMSQTFSKNIFSCFK